jgi:ATP synthase protein I
MRSPNGRSSEPGTAPLSDSDLHNRLDRLSRDLDSEQAQRKAAEGPNRPGVASYSGAFRLASEFVAGILVGAGLGWGLDRLAGTSPWGLIGLVLLGFVAGVFNVVRAAGEMSSRSKAEGEGGDRP